MAVVVLYASGITLMLYPAASNLLNRERNMKIISAYEENLGTAGEEELAEMMETADAYNRDHRRNYVIDAFTESGGHLSSEDYNSFLDLKGDGVMGYLDIPGIGVMLAVYHGTDPEVLGKGAGHVEGTSLPVGGESTHSVIAAHRGLPQAKLFTDLDRMKTGDLFYVHVLNRTLAYRVEQIITVDPDDIDALKIEEGRDLLTLLTCTPYGVNTKRLLVRGERVPYEEQISESSVFRRGRPPYIELLITSLTAVMLITAIAVRKSRRCNNV